MADKIAQIDTDQFKGRLDKGKAIGEHIDNHNEKLQKDKEKTFNNDLDGINRYVSRRATRSPKYFFFGKR